MFVQTMYINKKNGSLANAPDANSPGSTSETPVGTTPIDNIAQSSKESNISKEINPDAVEWEENTENRPLCSPAGVRHAQKTKADPIPSKEEMGPAYYDSVIFHQSIFAVGPLLLRGKSCGSGL